MFRQGLRFFSGVSSSKDYYKILGVTAKASKQEIRTAYLQLAKLHHPDSASGNEEKFKELGEAWSVLGNEDSRRNYDNNKDSWYGNNENSQGFPYRQQYGYNESEWQNPQKNPFEEFFKQQEQSRRGKHTEYYEFYDRKSGKKVFYSFTSNKSTKGQGRKSSYKDYVWEHYEESNKEWKDSEQKSGILDLLTLTGLVFSSILCIAMFSKLLRRRNEMESPYEDYYKNYTNPVPKEHVWDEFAKEMSKRR